MTEKSPSSNKTRRVLSQISVFSTSLLHLRNPYVIAVWSALFPGAGHMLLSKYIRAYALFLWEFGINLASHVNLALFYTLLGRFDEAKAVVDIRLSLLYIPTFIFAVWDSYRSAVDMNKHYTLASRENAPVTPFYMSSFGVTYLDKRPPLVAPAWCAMNPGIGQINLQRIVNGVFIMFWWVVVVYFSNALTAIHLTFFGQFDYAREVIDPQWFMNIPSLLFFCVYATYSSAVETNKLFDREQAQYLAKNYQSPEFRFPALESGEVCSKMYVLSVFKQSLQVELAVTALTEEGVAGRDILAVPVEKTIDKKRLFDTMYSSTGDSLMDLPMILAAFAALFGSIYGFILAWGPIVWGVIGAAAGFGTGFLIKLLIFKKKRTAGHECEVILFIACRDDAAGRIKQIMRDNGALGVSLAGGTAQ